MDVQLCTDMAVIDAEFLKILACPAPDCRQPLELRDDHLRCTGCGARYRIENDWPVLIPEEAEPPTDNTGPGKP